MHKSEHMVNVLKGKVLHTEETSSEERYDLSSSPEMSLHLSSSASTSSISSLGSSNEEFGVVVVGGSSGDIVANKNNADANKSSALDCSNITNNNNNNIIRHHEKSIVGHDCLNAIITPSKEKSDTTNTIKTTATATTSPRTFYIPTSTHREDSGIFASDDANSSSSATFSQSPSPDLLDNKKVSWCDQQT